MSPTILLTSIFALLIGLAVTFFGERIFKISLSSTGFAVGAVLVGGLVLTVIDNVIAALVAGAIAGLITAFLARSAYRTALFIMGFAMSAIIATYIGLAMDAVTVDIQNLENIDPNTLQSMFPLIIAGSVMSMVSGALVVIFDTPILRVATAIFGAIVFSISGFVLTTGMETLPQSTASLVSVQLFVWGALWIPLAIAGVVFQFFGVTWLFKLLQIDQASRKEQKRRQAYYQQKQAQRPPSQGYPQNPQQGDYPPNQPPPQQGGYPQNPQSGQQPPQQGGYPQNPQQGNYRPNPEQRGQQPRRDGYPQNPNRPRPKR